MPLPQEIIEFYKNLAECVEQRINFLSSLDLSNAEPSVPVEIKEALSFNLDSMKVLDSHALPSKCLFMHMIKIENAIKALWIFSQSTSAQELEKLPALKREIIEGLTWFKQSFVGRLLSEVDAHNVSVKIRQVSTVQDPIPALRLNLIKWFDSLNVVAGDELQLPESAKQFNDLQVNMCRVDAAHERISAASQDEWLSENALYAINAFRGKVKNLKEIRPNGLEQDMVAASSIESEVLGQFRNLYKRFQSFVSNSVIASQLNIEDLDSKLCYALEGKNSQGQKFQNDDKLASQLLRGLGPLDYFKPRECLSPLVELIERENRNHKNMAGNNLANHQNFNACIIGEVIALAESQPHRLFCSERFSVDNYRIKSFSLSDLEEPLSTREHYEWFKNINHHLSCLMFSQEIIVRLIHIFSPYSLNNSLSINDVDKNSLRNYIFLMQEFIDKNALDERLGNVYTTLTSLKKFIEHAADRKLLVGDDCILQLELIKQMFLREIDKAISLKLDNANKLKTAYELDVCNTELIEARPVQIFNTGNNYSNLNVKLGKIRSDISASFDGLTSLLKGQIASQQNNYQSKQLVLMGTPLSHGCTKKTFEYLIAKEAFIWLNNSVTELVSFLAGSHADLKASSFMNTTLTLNKGLLLIEKLKESSERKLIIVEQLEYYAFLVQSFLPTVLDNKPLVEIKFTSLLEASPMARLPLHWLLRLESDNEFFAQYQLVERVKAEILTPNLSINDMISYWSRNIDALQVVIQQKTSVLSSDKLSFKIKSAKLISLLKDETELNKFDQELLVDLNKYSKYLNCKNFWKEYLPKLLSLATQFEIDNNFEMGALVNCLLSHYQEFHFELLNNSIDGVSIEQHYDLEKMPYYCDTAKNMSEQSILTQARKEVALVGSNLNLLRDFFAKLELLQSYYFRDASGLSQTLLWCSAIFVKLSDASYLEDKRKIKAMYQSLQLLLNNESNEFSEHYLSSEADFSKNIVRLLEHTKEKILKLSDSSKHLKLELSSKESLLDFYQEKTDRHLSKQGAEPVSDGYLNREVILGRLLNSMASQLIDEHFSISIKGPLQFVQYKRKGHLLVNEKIQFAKKQFISESMDAILTHKSVVINTILHNDALMSQSGAQIKAYIFESLKAVYDEKIEDANYYIKLDRVKKLIEEFKEYLNSPQWCTENKETIKTKRSVLENINNLLLKFNVQDNSLEPSTTFAQERFNMIKRDILGSDKGKVYKDKLTEDINPSWSNYNEIIEYISYWLMRLFRVLSSIVTQQTCVDKREAFANKIIGEFENLDISVEEDLAPELEEVGRSSASNDDFGKVVADNLRALWFWSPEASDATLINNEEVPTAGPSTLSSL